MSKVKIHYILNEKEECLKGIKRKNKLIFYDQKVKTEIDIENKIIRRINDEYEIELNLKNNTGFYKTIEGNFILEPKLIKYDNLDTLTIIYELNGQTFKFNIEVVE